MAKTAGVHLPTWEALASLTTTSTTDGVAPFLYGAGIYWDKGDYLYMFNQAMNTYFYRYNLKYDAWQQLQDMTGITANSGNGIEILWHETESKFYIKSGSYAFASWTVAGGVAATSLANVNNSEYAGFKIFSTDTAIHASGDADKIYYCQGEGETSFEVYSISGNSWSALSALPEDMGWVGWLPTVDPLKIYAISKDTEKRYEYTIATNTWSSSSEWLPNVDAINASGITITADDAFASTSPGSYIYTIPYYNRYLYRGDFSTGELIPFRNMPILDASYYNAGSGRQMCYAETGGKKYLYRIIVGNTTTKSYYFFRTEIF